jgi:hypothetical protein
VNGYRFRSVLASCLLFASHPGASESNLSGSYVYLLVTQTVTKLPIIEDYVATTRSIALVDLDHRGQVLAGSGPICSVSIDGSSSLVRTELPRAFVASLPSTHIDARLSPKQMGLTLVQPPQALVVGARLAKPASDPLPRDANDVRVFDQDRDGKPGVTVRVRGIMSGDVFVIQRSSSSLRGHQTPNGFSGQVQFSVEQHVLGATSPFLRGNPKGAPNPKGSYFWLGKLPKGSGCADAVRRVARVHNAESAPR